MIRRDEVIGFIGPLLGDSPSTYWNLLVARDRLVAWPYTFVESLRAELAARFPFLRNPGMRLLTEDPIEFQNALEGRRLRLYLHGELETLTVRVRAMHNQIALRMRSGDTETYSIRDRGSTDRYREILCGAFPDVYREEGVPTTVAGKILKM